MFSTNLFSDPLLGGWHILRGLLVGLLVLSLVACSGFKSAPPTSVIEQAVVQQFEQTQQALQKQLFSSKSAPPALQIGHIDVDRTQRTSGDQTTYRIQGTYTLSGKSLSRSLRQIRNPFEIYLQSQDKGQTWSLLPPKG
ncbi:MAG TPA: hypothetical protein V6D07_15110 [Trichocoleus sp.]